MLITDELLVQVSSFERSVPWMYGDTGGNPTIGTGHLLPTQDAAAAIDPLCGQEWPIIKHAPAGMYFTLYRTMTTFRLPSDQIAALLKQDLGAKAAQLEAGYPGFANLPEPAQEALLDITFNAGFEHLMHEFTHMNEAIAAGDWETAAVQSKREPPISEARNEWTRQQFLAAI